MTHPALILGTSSPLTNVIPGLMIWTVVFFLIVMVVLKRYAFGPIQKTIDERHNRIHAALGEADHARDEARRLLEEHRQLIGQARSEAEEILSEARRIGEAQRERVREEADADRARRLEETHRQLEQATSQAIGQIREEVGLLSVIAAEKIARKSLDADDQRRLIDEALAEIDFSRLESGHFQGSRS